MVEYIQGIVDNGYAYESNGSVYFSVQVRRWHVRLDGGYRDVIISLPRRVGRYPRAWRYSMFCRSAARDDRYSIRVVREQGPGVTFECTVGLIRRCTNVGAALWSKGMVLVFLDGCSGSMAWGGHSRARPWQPRVEIVIGCSLGFVASSACGVCCRGKCRAL